MSPSSPLVVYLDTQDYANIFKRNQPVGISEAYRELLALRDEGKIAIGYSGLILVEFITRPSVEYQEERIERGRLVKEICQGHAFPFPSDLKDGYRFPNGGLWLSTPDRPVLPADLIIRIVGKEFKETIEKLPNTNRATKRLLLSRGLRRFIEDFGLGRDWVSGMKTTLPISQEIIDGRFFERLISGEISKKTFEEAASRWASDPEAFSRIVYEYGESENVMDRFFSSTIDKLEEAISKIDNFHSQLKAFNMEQMERRRTLIKNGMEASKAKKLVREIKNPLLEKEVDLTELAGQIGEKRVGHFQIYFDRLKRPGYRFKRSDAFDLWHLIYAYDCDFFRCDAAMGDLLKDYVPLKGRLVTSFVDLPRLVRKRLSQG